MGALNILRSTCAQELSCHGKPFTLLGCVLRVYGICCMARGAYRRAVFLICAYVVKWMLFSWPTSLTRPLAKIESNIQQWATKYWNFSLVNPTTPALSLTHITHTKSWASHEAYECNFIAHIYYS